MKENDEVDFMFDKHFWKRSYRGFMLKCGDFHFEFNRYRDLRIVQEAKFALSPVFFFRKNSPYHKLVYNELNLEVSLPKDLKGHYLSLTAHGSTIWRDVSNPMPGNFSIEKNPLLMTPEDYDKLGFCQGAYYF